MTIEEAAILRSCSAAAIQVEAQHEQRVWCMPKPAEKEEHVIYIVVMSIRLPSPIQERGHVAVPFNECQQAVDVISKGCGVLHGQVLQVKPDVEGLEHVCGN